MHPVFWAIGGALFIYSIKQWKSILKTENKDLIEQALEQYDLRNTHLLSKIQKDLSEKKFDENISSIIEEKLNTLRSNK